MVINIGIRGGFATEALPTGRRCPRGGCSQGAVCAHASSSNKVASAHQKLRRNPHGVVRPLMWILRCRHLREQQDAAHRMKGRQRRRRRPRSHISLHSGSFGPFCNI
ncbi:hypothetical protein GDO78_011274 [Eleutherodactylus coqui]|uniref:Uncharacterized protein n=1 Tax=Eleutherodactylus coqui TaxID=57060 RepID=A0A8J6F7H4_ELECQ|nr:hypothetical protein GDO78_011274 [Eleutherodactylus coqui]